MNIEHIQKRLEEDEVIRAAWKGCSLTEEHRKQVSKLASEIGEFINGKIQEENIVIAVVLCATDLVRESTAGAAITEYKKFQDSQAN